MIKIRRSLFLVLIFSLLLLTSFGFRRKLSVRSFGTSNREASDQGRLQQDDDASSTDGADSEEAATPADEESPDSEESPTSTEDEAESADNLTEASDTTSEDAEDSADEDAETLTEEDSAPSSDDASIEESSSDDSEEETSLQEPSEEDIQYPPQSCITNEGVELLCHHRGVCFQGTCLCTEDWHGDDCLEETDDDLRFSEVITGVFAVLAIPLGFILSMCSGKIYRLLTKKNEEEAVAE
ncbi:unnamed protein product [Moneuplotes crassus]|uniref:EGF-like domain-containing protein n=1 Tax=Euplotes crassus TaxID=5936 RepID=A0AAD1UPP6_EUPCR|nr:unnamed protein product [Moneuplotes crassus]